MKRQSIADDSEPIVECSRQAAPSIQAAQDNCSNGSTQHQEQEKREIAGEDQEDLGYTHTLVRYKKGKTTGYKNQQHLYPNYGKKKDLQQISYGKKKVIYQQWKWENKNAYIKVSITTGNTYSNKNHF